MFVLWWTRGLNAHFPRAWPADLVRHYVSGMGIPPPVLVRSDADRTCWSADADDAGAAVGERRREVDDRAAYVVQLICAFCADEGPVRTRSRCSSH